MPNFNKVLSPLLITVIVLISLIAVILYTHNKAEQKKLAVKMAKIKAQEKDDLDKLFDIYLNNFKTDLRKAATRYKGSRKVLKEILSPYNFETAEYTKENYNFFKNHIATDLRKKSVEIINIFQEYNDKLKNDLENKNSEITQLFLLKWKDMSDKQLNNYIIFFEKEEQLIKAYEEIMEFYYIHSNLFSLDDENNILLFDREEDKQKEKILLDKINSIKERKKQHAP